MATLKKQASAQARNDTAVVSYDDPLVRRGWMSQGIIQAASKSFWLPFTGTDSSKVVYQKNETSAAEGNTVVFDYSGNYATEGYSGYEQAYGKGEAKMKFSSTLTIEVVRYPINNGKKFDGKNIGDLSITEHANSKSLLADMFIRAKDQYMFDAAQGFLRGEEPTHIIRPNDVALSSLTTSHKMTYDFLARLEDAAKPGRGFTTGSNRRPIEPYMTVDGEGVWLCIIDAVQKRQLMQDPTFRSIMTNADVRGENNTMIKGVVARLGNLIISEVSNFYGSSSSNALPKTKCEIAGLRTRDLAGNWYGRSGYNPASHVASRGLILGKGALQFGVGMMPDYKWQPSQDFQATSESCLEAWVQVQRTKLVPADADYDDAKVANIDYGMFVFDTYNS